MVFSLAPLPQKVYFPDFSPNSENTLGSKWSVVLIGKPPYEYSLVFSFFLFSFFFTLSFLSYCFNALLVGALQIFLSVLCVFFKLTDRASTIPSMVMVIIYMVIIYSKGKDQPSK